MSSLQPTADSLQLGPATTDVVVSARGIDKSYRQGTIEYHVLRNVGLELKRGEFVAVMGPSGSGKSTLLHILGLMLSPTRAETLRIDGVETLGLSDTGRTAVRRDKIGFVFQRFNLLPVLNAKGNLGIALRLRRVAENGQVESCLDLVGLAAKGHLKPGQMSMGEQQRLAFARAVIHRPAVLLADEPTGSLDSANTRRIMELMHRLRRELNQTIVMVTHNEELAKEADRVMVMLDGRLVGK